MECGGPHPWLQCSRGGHRGSYARPRSPISLGRLAQPPGAPGHLRPVGHGLESDGSRSSGTPPPQNCPSRSMSCYQFCWLIFSGVVRGETTRWCATAIIRQWSPVFAPALASTRVLCTHLIPRYINTHTNHLADDLSRNRVLQGTTGVPLPNPHPAGTSGPSSGLDLSAMAGTVQRYFAEGIDPEDLQRSVQESPCLLCEIQRLIPIPGVRTYPVLTSQRKVWPRRQPRRTCTCQP